MYLISPKKMLPLTLAVLLAAGLVNIATAHHSRSNFDMDTQLEFTGVITEYSWRNPHTFAILAVEGESGDTEEFLFELNSVSVMTRSGWTRETMKVGDRVTVVANPDFDTSKNLYYSNYWVLPDGVVMISGGGGGGSAPEGAVRVAPRQVDTTSVSTDLSGIWRPAGGRFGVGGNTNDNGAPAGPRMSLGGQGAASGLPLTAIGQAEIDNFQVEDNPGFSCISKTPPWLFSGVGAHRFSVEEDKITIRHEIIDVDRIIHLGLTEHPAGIPQSHLGHSIGWYEGETLVVDTAHFAPAQWGIGGGVSSSDQKHLVERFTLGDDGRSMDYVYTMTDPVYLSQPITIATQMGLDANYPFQDEYGCDAEASSRHIVE